MKKSNIPTIRLVTPSYNQAKFIRQTVDSVLGQNDPSMEYWVIDGRSTDETKSILKGYGTAIHWISERDRGQADAIDKGLLKMWSEINDDDIFAYINSDDYYLTDAFETVRQTFLRFPNTMWIVGDAVIVDERGDEIQSLIRIYKKLLRLFPSSLNFTNPYPQPSVFIKAKALRRVGLFSRHLHYVMDYDYWLRLYQAYGSPVMVSKALSAFRIHSQSKGRKSFRDQFAEEYRVNCHYVKSPILRMLHLLHTKLVVWVYTFIK